MKKQNQSLGEFLQSARERKGLSLREVEKATGISNPYLSQVEKGKIQQPSPVPLHKLSELYEISYAQVLGLAGYPVPTESSEEFALTAFQSRLGPTTRDEEDAIVEYLEFMRARKKTARRR